MLQIKRQVQQMNHPLPPSNPNAPQPSFQIVFGTTKVRVKNKPEDLNDKVEKRTQEDADVTAADSRTKMREDLKDKIYWYWVWWSVFVVIIVLLQGFGKRVGFSLPETLLSIIVGSTTASVIGLISVMVHGLFGGKPKKDKE